MLPLGKNFGIALRSCQTQRSYKTINTTEDVNLTDQDFINYHPQQSCSKVMFSQASVSHSVHTVEGGVWETPLGRHPPAQCMLEYTPLLPSACWDTHTPLPNACWDTHLSCPVLAEIHTSPAQCMLGYTPPAQCMLGYTPLAQCMLGYTNPTPPPTPPADGTHPTGMHSCYIGILKLFVELAHYPPPPPTPS